MAFASVVTPNLQTPGHRLRHDWSGIHMRAFIRKLRNDEHTRRYSIEITDAGWEVREEQDSRVVRRVAYQDWHRVERARRSMTIEANQLQDAGWQVE
jgi:hypothetical protein